MLRDVIGVVIAIVLLVQTTNVWARIALVALTVVGLGLDGAAVARVLRAERRAARP